jgi:hypothetical protein
VETIASATPPDLTASGGTGRLQAWRFIALALRDRK